MRFQFPTLTPTVKKLLIFLGAMFVLVAVVDNVFGIGVYQLLSLDVGFPTGTWVGLLWQPLTYWTVEPPVPGALLNVAITLLVIYLFLSPFEERFGPKRTLQLSAVGVLAGAASAIVLALALAQLGVSPSRFPAPSGAGVVSAVAFGAFPLLFADRKIFFFPLMIPLSPWAAIGIGLGITALMSVLNRDPFIFVMDAAAIGGGYAFGRWMMRPRQDAPSKAKKRRSGGPDLRVVDGGVDDDKPRWLN